MCTPQSFRPTMRTLPVIGLTRGPQSQVIFRDEKYLPLYTHSSSHTHLLFFLKLSWCQVPPSRLWVCPCKVHRIQCCLTNPPTVSFPPAPWAGFASTALPTLSRLPSDIVTSVHVSLYQTMTLLVSYSLSFADPTTVPVTWQVLSIG